MIKDLDKFVMNQTIVDNKTISQMCNCYRANGFMIGALAGITIYKIVKKLTEPRKQNATYHRDYRDFAER